MAQNSYIQSAKSLIESVKSKSLSSIERQALAVLLAGEMLNAAQSAQTAAEKRQQAELGGMMEDPLGKVFTTSMTDECFRSKNPVRAADQIQFLIKKYGIPKFFASPKKVALKAFSIVNKQVAGLMIPVVIHLIRKETQNVIVPGEALQLKKHIAKRRAEGVRINLNHLGEAILGEEEALRRLNVYLSDLKKPEIEYISIKISTIYSQINLLAWDQTLDILADRLRQLYRAAKDNHYIHLDGSCSEKFVNLDMEEYRDLHLTVALFKKVLSEPEFFHHQAGIVLQSYLPDSFLVQKSLTDWAIERVKAGGAPIKIRLVKGANLAMEQWEGALRQWPQAPYTKKSDVDANYKKMILYGCEKERVQAVKLGIGSHNLFDIAHTLLIRSERNIENDVCFEMLEGMADHMRRVVQELSGGMLLYCPDATKEEFQNAVAYLVRRLDENTAPDNFLRQAFYLKTGTPQWEKQAQFFTESCQKSEQVYSGPRRTQDRKQPIAPIPLMTVFKNEPDTDWSLVQNREWAWKIVEKWKNQPIDPIPIVIHGQSIISDKFHLQTGSDPSYPQRELYQYSLANATQVEEAVDTAKKSEARWSAENVKARADLLAKIGDELASARGDLIGAMIADTGKTIPEADVEVSEAIDFARYYAVHLINWSSHSDIEWKPKGTVLVTPPWNFPCSIPAGGILAALAGGNCVIFKPPVESILVAWVLVQVFWRAGVGKDILQFLPCADDLEGSQLIKDSRINAIILTGATSTAKLFLKMRPGLDLMAETGGKNTLVISAMSDRDLAIKDLIQSAFGHAGQKCSACSLAILEAEVYDDPQFRKQLYDAAKSLTVGSAWDLKTKVNPLIREPGEALKRGLSTLEKGEEWLLKPEMKEGNPRLWSPGIKLGVKPESFTFQQELFGPVLGLVRADTFKEALNLMNRTPYGLTGGLHSLDEREQVEWLKKIEVGNCYINRTITGAIVERQPFGGCKESNFGKGAKAGGPNYLVQLMVPIQKSDPADRISPSESIKRLLDQIKEKEILDPIDWDWLKICAESDAYHFQHTFSKDEDPSLVPGQDNIQRYVPRKRILLLVRKTDTMKEILREIIAAELCGTPCEISVQDSKIFNLLDKLKQPRNTTWVFETEQECLKRLRAGQIKRIRLLGKGSDLIEEALAEAGCNINRGSVMANGRLELLHFLREVSISRDYHRYGYLNLSR